jgi:hypothetical protein
MRTPRSPSDSDGDLGGFSGLDPVEPFQPRRCLKPGEDLARFGQQRFRLLAAVKRGEPLGVLEPGDSEIEGRAKLLEETARAFELALGLVGVSGRR